MIQRFGLYIPPVGLAFDASSFAYLKRIGFDLVHVNFYDYISERPLYPQWPSILSAALQANIQIVLAVGENMMLQPDQVQLMFDPVVTKPIFTNSDSWLPAPAPPPSGCFMWDEPYWNIDRGNHNSSLHGHRELTRADYISSANEFHRRYPSIPRYITQAASFGLLDENPAAMAEYASVCETLGCDIYPQLPQMEYAVQLRAALTTKSIAGNKSTYSVIEYRNGWLPQDYLSAIRGASDGGATDVWWYADPWKYYDINSPTWANLTRSISDYRNQKIPFLARITASLNRLRGR